MSSLFKKGADAYTAKGKAPIVSYGDLVPHPEEPNGSLCAVGCKEQLVIVQQLPVDMPKSSEGMVKGALEKGKGCMIESSSRLQKSTRLLLTSLPSHREGETSEHLMLVDRVNTALSNAQGSQERKDFVMQGSSEDEIFPDIEDDPGDCMTLDEFQSGLRKEAHVRRGRNRGGFNPKKGRVDPIISGK